MKDLSPQRKIIFIKIELISIPSYFVKYSLNVNVEQRLRNSSSLKLVKAGGSGKRGLMAMPPQSQISDADLQSLAQWLLKSVK
ncbi:hypothetical protein BCF11_2497 [Collimonas sp. PA-H2]|uniref:c-type cytochrome n=1 Tax=Collimonas sp. PA-H2 TaxID=1881062 RepID=UPI000BF5C778|nr:hypothetical protein [Collimonas sp. PA-H2]PFH10088.1 hypothetical protein BCF11_2497 [Collimonas sp. PA-H2]